MARRKHVAMLGDFSGGGRLAEAGAVFVFARTFIASPRMIRGADFIQIDVG